MEQLELFVEPPGELPSLQDLFHHLNRKYWNGALPLFRCEWSTRMITTWGCCYRTRRLIRISSFFRNRPLAELAALLCHEMIHIRYRGHGKRFKNELKRIGMTGDVQKLFPHLNEMTHRRRRPLKYVYVCPRCDSKIKRRRRISGYCARCYDAGVRSKFRLRPGRA